MGKILIVTEIVGIAIIVAAGNHLIPEPDLAGLGGLLVAVGAGLGAIALEIKARRAARY